ncbi:ribonuclease H-like domain-containing protein [Tanacetum coccineum]
MHFYTVTYQRQSICISLMVFEIGNIQIMFVFYNGLFIALSRSRGPGSRFVSYATRVGFYHSRCDSSLFILRQGSDTAYLLLYVDDIFLTTSSTTFLQQIISSLHKEFSMFDLGPLNYFLGISVTRDSSWMFLSQQQYALENFERVGMLNCQPSRAIQYITFTRLDLSYVVQGTTTYGVQLYASSSLSLLGYTDADWAGCPTTRRSTSGYCVFLGNNLISWSSKRQVTLSHSSAEAEYRGVANVVAETAWIRNLLRELHSPLSTTTLVYCDNVSAVYLSSNPVQHQQTKHIEIDIHFVRIMEEGVLEKWVLGWVLLSVLHVERGKWKDGRERASVASATSTECIHN